MLKAKLFYVLPILSLLILLPVFLFGQDHELVIPPFTDPSSPYVNEVVAGDTTAAGARLDPDRVYVLQRDGMYFINYRVEVDGFDVRMKAEDGTGTRPVIYLTTNLSTGSYPGEHFRLTGEGGNLWIKDLILVGFYEANPAEISNIPSGLIRTDVAAAGFDIEIDGCLLDNHRGQQMRTEGACRVIKVTNSMFVNNGDLGRSNLGAGKGIDLRTTSCDTLLMQNNTLVNFQDRVIRHRGSTGSINHFIFDHNTVINSFSYHGLLALGWVGDDVQITNNLLIDPFIAGNDTDAVRQSEFDESGELDAYGGGRMTWIFTVPNDSTDFTISNNYYSTSPEVQAFYDGITDPVHTGEGSPLTYHINGKLGADSATAFIKEDIALVETVEPMVNLGVWYRTPSAEGGAGKTKVTDNFVREDDDFDRQPWEYFDQTMDCGYLDNLGAATGSTTGGQVGDLNWDLVPSTGIFSENNSMPAEYQLSQNYPNPFNPSTMIKFLIAKANQVKLEIYNIAGQKIATLVDQKMNAGSHEVEWNASNVASGVYFYKLHYGTNIETKKMVLIR
jgi:hypothetical protein